MIWYVKTPLSKKEIAEYERWKQKHLNESNVAQAKLASTSSKKSFFEAQARTVRDRLGDYRSAPSLPPEAVPSNDSQDVRHRIDPEEHEEYLKREAAAQKEIELKKSRVGPTYNKGGPQYWSDGMMEDLKSGAHRRR